MSSNVRGALKPPGASELVRLFGVEATDGHGSTRMGARIGSDLGPSSTSLFSHLELTPELLVFIRVHLCLSVVRLLFTAWTRLGQPLFRPVREKQAHSSTATKPPLGCRVISTV